MNLVNKGHFYLLRAKIRQYRRDYGVFVLCILQILIAASVYGFVLAIRHLYLPSGSTVMQAMGIRYVTQASV